KSPSKKSQSVESLKAEVCPWESQELESTNKAEICPWEAAAPPPGKEKSRQDKDGCPEPLKGTTKKSESTGRKKAEICPWESLGTEQPPEKPRARSPALPKSPSNKSQSVESLKAEVCPWEAQELESTDNAEICPWEAAAPPPGKEKSRQDKDGLFTRSKGPSKS
ncbi:GP179 protein, partial [Phaetusa simplex]|nr:GP179 protein [Phaetusa simplex]